MPEHTTQKSFPDGAVHTYKCMHGYRPFNDRRNATCRGTVWELDDARPLGCHGGWRRLLCFEWITDTVSFRRNLAKSECYGPFVPMGAMEAKYMAAFTDGVRAKSVTQTFGEEGKEKHFF